MTMPAAMAEPLVERAPALMQVAGLSKRYGEQRAFIDVSFDVRAGEVLGPDRSEWSRQDNTAGDKSPVSFRPMRARSLARRAAAHAHRRDIIFYLPDGLRPWDDQFVVRVVEFFAAVYGHGQSRVAETIRSVGPFASAEQARQRIIERIWPSADAGARAAHAAAGASHGRAVRWLRSAADARDHGRAP